MKTAPAIILPLALAATAAEPAPPQPAAQPAQQEEARAISPAESHIRAGIVITAKVLDILSKIQDRDTAEAAVAPLMRLGEELTLWAKATATLPQLSDLERMEMEDRYMPVIKRVNDRIKSQGERIAAAEFYGSRNLPAALVHIVQSTAQ
ncbi:MAG: hypothetical protein MJ056_09465 [Akkermansia sp.]|nr:hypothetical protein [Akkermansia sp.]